MYYFTVELFKNQFPGTQRVLLKNYNICQNTVIKCMITWLDRCVNLKTKKTKVGP